MSKFTVPVIRVSSIEKIENADSIEVAVIGDYRCVVQKNKHKPNDLVVYIPEASIVPQWLLKKMNLEGKLAGSDKNRVKAIKLRGVLSQGLVYTLQQVSPQQAIMEYFDEALGEIKTTTVAEHQDVQQLLGIKKYEPVIPANFSGDVYNAGTHITVDYDIENIKKYPDVLQDGEQVVMTEKIHGCLTGDALIMLPNGEEVSMDEIVRNENITHVLSFDIDTGAYVPKRVTGRMCRPNVEAKMWVKLTFDNGRTLTLTEDHPVYSRDRRCYVFASELKPGEDIECPYE